MGYGPILNFIATIAIAVSCFYIFCHWKRHPRISTPFLFMAVLYLAIGYRGLVGIVAEGYMFEAAAILLFGALMLYAVSHLLQKKELMWTFVIMLFIPVIYLLKPDALFIAVVTSSIGYLLSFSAFISLLLFKERLRGKLAASLGMSYAFLSLIFTTLLVSTVPRYLPWFIPHLMLAASFAFMAYSFSTLPGEIIDVHAKFKPKGPRPIQRTRGARRRRPKRKTKT